MVVISGTRDLYSVLGIKTEAVFALRPDWNQIAIVQNQNLAPQREKYSHRIPCMKLNKCTKCWANGTIGLPHGGL